MKLIWFSLPAGLALASGGLLLYWEALRPHVEATDIINDQPRHPVTPEMVRKTNAEVKKLAPAFALKGTDGKTVTLASPGATRPQFIYFVMDGCPCSFEAEPLFHDLSKKYRDKVDFVSITDAEPAKAKRWSTQMLVPYPVVSDHSLEVINAYQATNSVFSVLVDRTGRIVKAWPGYSVGILQEMNRKMAQLSDTPVTAFDTKYAPVKEASGCAFLLKK